MLASKKDHLSTLFVILLSSIFIVIFYGDILMAPNEHLFTNHGDGLSQYFNITAYIKNSTGLFDNSTSNYPFSGHIIYYDSQPFWSALYKGLCYIFPVLKNYTVGYMNMLAIVFMWVTPFFLYGILRRIGVGSLFAAYAAMGIMLLEPQVFRLQGHFALAFCAAIPSSLYLLLRVHEGVHPKRWLCLLAFTNIVWLYTHPYLGLMCSLICGAIWLFYWLGTIRTSFKKPATYAVPALSALVPILFFQLVVKLTDTHTGKPVDIFGIFSYHGEADDVFVPTHPPFRSIIDVLWHPKVSQNWEGWCYIGFGTMIVFLIFVLNYIYKVVFRKPTIHPEKANPVVLAAFLGSIPFLLLSWAIPLRQFPDLLEMFPIIKQFRSLGRFAWVFYYIGTLSAMYITYRAAVALRATQEKRLATIILVAVPLFFYLEGYSPHYRTSKTLAKTPNFFLKKNGPEMLNRFEKVVDPSKYQAILPLPFYYLGSGNYFRLNKPQTTRLAMLTSVRLNIPTIPAVAARGDVWESRDLIQTVSAPYYYKKIQDHMPSKKPFLITLSTPGEALENSEKQLLERAKLLMSDELGRAYYELSYEDLFALENNKAIEEFEQKRAGLYEKEGGWLVSDSSVYVFHEDFEDQPAKHTFRGKGAYSYLKRPRNTMLNIPAAPANAYEETRYSVRMWVFNGAIDVMNYFYVETRGHRAGGQDYITLARPDEAVNINDDWSLLEYSFTVPAGKYHSFELVTFGTTYAPNVAYIDEVMVKTGYGPIYRVEKTDNAGNIQELTYNGHQIIRQ